MVLAAPKNTYFHCAPIGLSPGAVIQPGNWGRVLDLYQITNNQINQQAVRETILELFRQVYAPTKASRLKSIFVCPTLAEAIAFRDRHQRTQLIYEVVPVLKDGPTHVGDYELAIAPYPPRYFRAMFDLARDYWAVAPTANHEVLFECAVYIVSVPQVPPPP
jgi:hypothetical protein